MLWKLAELFPKEVTRRSMEANAGFTHDWAKYLGPPVLSLKSPQREPSLALVRAPVYFRCLHFTQLAQKYVVHGPALEMAASAAT